MKRNLTHPKLNRCLLAAWLFVGVLGQFATASPVFVPDFSFENSTNIPGGAVATSGTNWIATGNGGHYLQNFTNSLFSGTNTLPAPADGTNCFVEGLNGHPGFCWQDLGPLQSNTVYTLTIAVGQTFTGGSGVGKIALINGYSPFQKPLAETPIDSSTVTPGSFSDFTVVYTAGYQVNGDLTILMEGDAGTQILFDNVRLDATALPQAPTAVLPSLPTSSGTVYQGTQVTLTELPAGQAPFHYQWQSDLGTGGATFTDIASATNASYVADTSAFTLGASVEFRVVVTNALGTSTSPAATLTTIQGPPVVVRNTLPATAHDIVGDQITFTAVVDGSRPLAYQWVVDNGGGPFAIPDATNATLTLSNVQLSDVGNYYLVVSNQFGVLNTSPSTLTVDYPPTDVSGIIISPAAQTGFGTTNTFVPTWTLATNSLIAGRTPSSSAGNFTLEHAGGTNLLTDGRFGILPPEGSASLDVATCGTVGSGAGSAIAYALPASATGYDLTNVVVYGGWSDAGRDQQHYNIYYSTVANPTNFNNLIAYVNFNPVDTANAQSATRITITGTNGVVARNVAAIMFDFNVLAEPTENGYTGYAEFQVFGVPSAPKPVLSVDTQPATGSDVEGSQVNFVAAFTSSTPMTYQWQVDKGSGPTDIAGATNGTLTLTNLQLADAGSYSLKASNASGTSISRASAFVVNPLPYPDAYGVIVSPATQTGTGSKFTPTWTFPAGSLIAGAQPSAKGTGTFTQEGAGGQFVLTDGQFGFVGSGNNSTLATCGSGTGGHSLTYTLTGSQSGYDLSNIVVYAGWSDGGRDQQAYAVYYSTVAAPTTFIPLSSVSYNPTLPGSVPSTDRITFAGPGGAPLATGVAKVMFDFTNPAGENGYSGYAEIAMFGSPSAPTTLAPTLITDTLPATGSDVVGSQVTFTAGFNSSLPMSYQWQKYSGGTLVNVPGATSATLTLTNLQLTDSGSYSLLASNALGVASSTTNTFTVNPAPAPSGSVIIANANQTSFGVNFTPTWTVASGSLIAGLAPTTVGSGSFVNEACGGVPMLTDGQYGSVGVGNHSFASCGVGAGTTLTYTLPPSPIGYDLSKIVTYGGWGDNGRDQQHYTVSYATVANPSNFIQLASASYNPTIPGSTPSADRVTITPAAASTLAQNVTAVQFTFTTPTGENGWSGYAELGVFGSATQAPLKVNSFTVAGGNLLLVGTGGTPGAGYTWLASTNVAAPLSTWITNSTGVFDNSGAFTGSIPVSTSQPAWFFKLRIP